MISAFLRNNNPESRKTKKDGKAEMNENGNRNGWTESGAGELPIGFGVALARDERALFRFGNMTERERRQILFEARHAHNRMEIQNIVKRIGEMG